MSSDAWTSRDVTFVAWPRTSRDELDALTDALAERFYPSSRLGARLPHPAIGRCDREFSIGGFPWWVPRRVALRVVVSVAGAAGVVGQATFAVTRNVL